MIKKNHNNTKNKEIVKTKIMGILNVTPDSFYDGGKYNKTELAIKHAEEMIEEGADIIDIGGESTRPWAVPISPEEEKERVLPVISELRKINKDIPISIDTYKSEVAEEAIDMGATIVNDVSGLQFDKNMPEVISKKNVSVIIMHIKGTPRDMQINPTYEDVVKEIKEFLKERIEYATENGINKRNIFIDPGIGFGKTTEHNLEILKRLKEFKELGFPVVLGTSRKSFIGRILGTEENPIPPEERLEGSIATYVWAVIQGVDILRVHDVKQTKMALKVIDRIINSK